MVPARIREARVTEHFDRRESRSPPEREADLFRRLPDAIRAALAAPAYAERLAGIDPASIADRAALAGLPVLRKSELPALHKAAPPFGGFVPGAPSGFARLYTSPGPIFEPEPGGEDPWGTARALFAAGFRPGDVVLNTFSYHLVPGGMIMDSAARAVGCAVIPAGPGNTDAQLELMAAYRPSAYCGTPDFLKILIDAAGKAGMPHPFRKAVVSGAAFPRSLQDEMAARGVSAYQTYATADLGAVAYETEARDGLVLNEDMIVELVRPGTGDPVPEGDVGEIVVTSLDPRHPWIRLALGDLTAFLPAGPGACGRTNRRIRGWLGRADQTAKIKGMFVRPEQIAEIGRRHPELGRLRLVVTREAETDRMVLRAEASAPGEALAAALGETLLAVVKLRGAVELAAPGSLPNDGKVIADERPAA